ncbi:hypothetical protein Nham_4203 (plasmid) [Nitrobacter hamburgensis X14]|uniref:Uncharacterized protein n=1 Tax=Nitrobacter hamburgensis (strain DSM 10229 / NCIMB 13809 / X14) TaxID=323097 RepID=Q1QG22_NITHX|nr:hypothetical protein [Nitrobacter hamburgensis]ABE64825.1 hypothetical protein Nham_4203 [Nitrobacter hamburgensis X14]
MSNDPETRPSVGQDVHQDPQGVHPPAAPNNMRQGRPPAPANTPNPDPGYPDQTSMNQNNPDQQQNRGERPRVQQEQDEATRKAEIRKAVEEDDPDNNPRGQEKTGFSGGP